MQTVFSHIVQTRYSQERENIATEALLFILDTFPAAHDALMKLLRGITPDLPDLHFGTQQTDNNVRPDLWGNDSHGPRVLIENKFWAGLTKNQPLAYLRILEKRAESSALLVVVPDARQQSVWSAMVKRLAASGISPSDKEPSPGIFRHIATDIGPSLAITSWATVLQTLEEPLADDPQAMDNLNQLRSLCDAADQDSFTPFSDNQLTDQTTPAFFLQLSAIVRKSISEASDGVILNKKKCSAQANWGRVGQYILFAQPADAGCWFGTHFRLWKEHGGTPLWLYFEPTRWSRAPEVRSALEPWAKSKGVVTVVLKSDFAVGLQVPTGQELESSAAVIVGTLRDIAEALTVLEPKPDTGS